MTNGSTGGGKEVKLGNEKDLYAKWRIGKERERERTQREKGGEWKGVLKNQTSLSQDDNPPA